MIPSLWLRLCCVVTLTILLCGANAEPGEESPGETLGDMLRAMEQAFKDVPPESRHGTQAGGAGSPGSRARRGGTQRRAAGAEGCHVQGQGASTGSPAQQSAGHGSLRSKAAGRASADRNAQSRFRESQANRRTRPGRRKTAATQNRVRERYQRDGVTRAAAAPRGPCRDQAVTTT